MPAVHAHQASKSRLDGLHGADSDVLADDVRVAILNNDLPTAHDPFPFRKNPPTRSQTVNRRLQVCNSGDMQARQYPGACTSLFSYAGNAGAEISSTSAAAFATPTDT